MQLSRLRVSNEDFLVSSMIDRCPKSMMLRELVKNAVEAAANAIDGGHRVEIGPLIVGGTRKLSIWNTGPGMDGDQLYRMCDIASSIGKPNGLDQNFGMGAKVASLPSNQHGIRYRSCKGGCVHQVIMGKRNDIYGRLAQVDSDGTSTDIVDVTALASEHRDLTFDWTEVVLFGNRADQDTVSSPYDDSPKMPLGWVAEELYARFYSLPQNINIILRDGCNNLGGDRPFVPLSARPDAFTEYDAIRTDNGIILHYYYDSPDPDAQGHLMSARNALQPPRSTAALIYRGEFYDVRPVWAWQHEAPIFGLPFGSRYLSVHIEVPDDFPLRPDGYRQFLTHTHNLQQHVQAREFATLVLRHRPTWLLKLLQNFAPDGGHAVHLRDEVGSLFRTLGIRRRWWPPGDGATMPSSGGDGVEYEIAPQIVILRDETDIRERGMAGKAARFYAETHQIFINTGYSAFIKFSNQLTDENAAHDVPEDVTHAAQTITEQILIREICRKLVFALGKRDEWDHWEVEQAHSMYSLTLAADDNDSFYGEARRRMASSLGEPAASPPDPRMEHARVGLAKALEEWFTLSPRQPDAAPFEFTIRLQSLQN